MSLASLVYILNVNTLINLFNIIPLSSSRSPKWSLFSSFNYKAIYKFLRKIKKEQISAQSFPLYKWGAKTENWLYVWAEYYFFCLSDCMLRAEASEEVNTALPPVTVKQFCVWTLQITSNTCNEHQRLQTAFHLACRFTMQMIGTC